MTTGLPLFEYKSQGNELAGPNIWDDLDLPWGNMDLLQKVQWDFLADGKILFSLDDGLEQMIKSKKRRTDQPVADPFNHMDRLAVPLPCP
jgi:hypothetical protein